MCIRDRFWNDAALERAMNREARGAFGKRGANIDVYKRQDAGHDRGRPERLR